ncbi:autophagy-related protein 2 [Mercurialis annua]|uniref:autophagy-related protein 2 n=1 Tax=Mercurialis annua TaxID=3986 RepID=UPI00215F62A4|nr:autophagy-related protein 2 [Mercurialis annua]XP_050212204.1 autophagy-related protein 2 [Mercurialis annua]
MFGWNFAKSAEAVFSRWAMKRILKFLLKKKLGQFILGDIDLDQLDIQLRQGTIQLNDLALNVDYLNHKLGGTTPVFIKEGSVGSLSVKMPWGGKGFQVEVDELELVFSLASCSRSNTPDGDESTDLNQHSDSHMQSDGGNYMADGSANSSIDNVHEGVKTIANMVKWFLENFNVNIKNLIVAFEPYWEDDKKAENQKILVLRISETKCGTCVSEDANLNCDARVESFLGISHLTNFITFQGAVLELLQMDVADKQTSLSSPLGSSFNEFFSVHCPSKDRIPILCGSKGEFSGNLRLSIPWKNGSLDIRKVDATVSIDPLELRLQPSTIKWLLLLWNSYKTLEEGLHNKPTDSVDLNLSSHFYSSTLDRGSFSSAVSSLTGKESASDAMLPGSHLIPDWVPNSMEEQNKSVSTEDHDLGASVDQFFECFDGMRSSQSALGSSGMWNWTCSVFSALTAASSLASGSLHIPSEQQHIQTNLEAAVARISIILSFQDDYQDYLYNSKGNQSSSDSNDHYMVAECHEIFVALQVCPQQIMFEGKVKHIDVADYLFNGIDAMNFQLKECSGDSNFQTLSIQQLQGEVQGALPPFASPAKDPELNELGAEKAKHFVFRHMTKIELFVTSGVTHCHFCVKSDSADASLKEKTSFSLRLPNFILWVNFWSIQMFLDLLKDIRNHVKMHSPVQECSSVNSKHGSSIGDVKKGLVPGVSTESSTETLKGTISILYARIILCFPFGTGKSEGNFSWDQFIAFEFSAPWTFREGEVQDLHLLSNSSSRKRYTSKSTCSVNLKIGNLKAYVVNRSCESYGGTNSSGSPRQVFCAENILSVSNRAGCLSTISMQWQQSSVIGPLIFESAKSLATAEESRSRRKTTVKGSEFVSVTAMKDLVDTSFQIQEEIILSSVFVLHINLFSVTIDLGSSQYANLHNLLNQMINALSGAASEIVNTEEASSSSQTSFLLECVSVEILIRPDMQEDGKSSLQNELPGSWHCLKLKLQKLDLLSVLNIGSIEGAKFFWLSHGEGKLWGSVTGVPDKEFLLISCSNSSRKRGDGGGSNVLSSRLAGSDIVHLWDPMNFDEISSITVRCGTIVAVGGRLDWLDSISSFFTLPAHEVEKAGHADFQKGNVNAPGGTTFILKFVDIGLSYEPHGKNSVITNLYSDSDSNSSYYKEETSEPHVACLLAASSLIITSTVGENSANNFKIRAQDIGFLLCPAFENLFGTYSVEYLREMGYVKVAREALLEAILRINPESGLPWELECSESHIYVETCHDSTSHLIMLAAQLQPLFAPDLEESFVHLQARWDNVHQARESNEFNENCRKSAYNSPLSTSQVHVSGVDTDNKLASVGLMDEICEDAFSSEGNEDCQFDSIESRVCDSFDKSPLREACCLNIGDPESVSEDLFFDGSAPSVGFGSAETSYLQNGVLPELLEGYCLSDLRPLSELSFGMQSPSEILKCQSRNFQDIDRGRGNSGWYGDASLSVVENHISEASWGASLNQVLENRLPSYECTGSDEGGKPTGRIRLKNINLSWRMFGGSDWHSNERDGEASREVHGRDTTSYLEIVLSGIQLQYDLFPVGGIYASKLSLSVQDFYLCDRSKSAPWTRVLGYYRSKGRPRESSSKALMLELEAVRPDPQIPLEEYRLHVGLLPIILQLHQSQLDFLIAFFGAKSSSADQSLIHSQNSDGAKPFATKNLAGHRIAVEALLPYFQKFDVQPVILRVDYSPRRVDLAALGGGNYVELVNLVPWKGVELELKHVHAAGVYGWASVCETIIGEWLEDISQNQIHKVLQGLPTIRSLVAVGSGAAKLVSLPVESYRKDRRVVKGMQRGTIAFLRSISLEAVGLGVHLAAGAHDILLQAESILAKKIPSSVSWPVKGNTKPNVRCNQPKNAQQGFQQAYESLSDGLGRSASALVQMPLKKYQRGASAGSALATAVRGVPAAAIAPVSACASAAHYTLLGLRNSLDPEHKKESMDKYLGPSQSSDLD